MTWRYWHVVGKHAFSLPENTGKNVLQLRRIITYQPSLTHNSIVSKSLKKELLNNSRKTTCHRWNGFHTTNISHKIVPFYLSDIGEGIVEVTVKEWLVKPGDKVSQFDEICEVQSDKASVTITSRFDGVVKNLYYKVDDIARVGKPLVDIEVEGDEKPSDKAETESVKVKQAPTGQADATSEWKPVNLDEANSYNKPLATPAVRRIATENKVDLSLIQGTGRDNRVTKEDVLNFLNNVKTTSSATTTTTAVDTSSKDVTKTVTGYTKVMVKTMTDAWKIPHFTYSDEVDIANLVKFKPEITKLSQAYSVKITYMPFFIKAASLALNKHPILNSHFGNNAEITLRSVHNIGVAVDTPNGLIVPNVKNVHQLDVVGIAKELNRLQLAASKGQLNPNDLVDGTFTLSNIGVIGGTYTKPIIASPQVAIGALGKLQVLPRFDEDGNVVPGHIVNISWSADHRVIDGATVARFSNLWKLYLENPKLLILL